MVGLATLPDEYDRLHEQVFVPAVEAFAPLPPAPAVEDNAPYRDPDLPVAERVDDLLARMTLAEKIGQMTLVEKNSILPNDITGVYIGALLSGGGGYPPENTPAAWAAMVNGFQAYALATRLGIPLLYGADAVHGHNNVRGAVIFPHNIGLGAADDPELMEQIGRVTALEMAATGVYWNFAPVVAAPQDIRWGRTYEGYSENTERVARLAAAYLRGLQGDDLAARTTVLATPKHFVGDGGAVWETSTRYIIDQGVTDVDEETLRAVHLPPYIAAIDAGAMSIMASFSSWGGMKMHAQKYLITDVLKGELGFEGFVVSDWAGIDQISGNYYEAMVTAINAGIDMNMVPYDYRSFVWLLTRAVENGDVPIARIDDAVRRILTAKFMLGLFEHPYSDEALLDAVGSDEHRTLAREAVSRTLVLLKNENDALPIPAQMPVIFVGGAAAHNIGLQSGGWTIEWQGSTETVTPGTTIAEGIVTAASTSTVVYYDPTGQFAGVTDPAKAVFCVAVAGELPYAEGVGDRADLSLSSTDLMMLERMRARCDRLIVVLVSGRPLIVTDQIDRWDALVAAWLPGTEGQGVADVLFGNEPFTGKLPFAWPRSMEQVPLGALEAGEDEPLFPYGFGLEY
ncbi:MAG: glycoside hydrolase family 3 C-terminal domain-containing protein [Anaerolineae bacterium]|nr:glycoside hydrolase family 3 C-terminal domain-containing protein [Anaerolineae bacterium]